MLKPLLDRGIVPDFVTSLDFHEMSRRFFQGIDDFHGVHLVAEPKSSWHVIDAYDGSISILDSSFAHLLVGPQLAARGGLPPGATVAHLAFYLARYMGCDPIIFVGQDLAYTGHVFYVPGVEVHDSWTGEINRFNTMETKEWERIVRNREILRRIEDVHGQITRRLEEVKAAEKICDDFIEVLRDLEDLTRAPQRFNRRLQRVDELRALIQQHDLVYRIINSASQLAELRRFSADRKIDMADASGPELALRQLKRDLEFVGAVKDGAVDMTDILTETLARFDRRIAQNQAS